MGFLKTLWQNRISKSLLLIFLFILFVLLMDIVVMPSYVRLGKEVQLPDVVEMDIRSAQNRLEKSGFSVVISDSIYEANFPEGTVIEQMPLPFTTVKSGRHVYLKISIGEKPIIMPNLFYKSPRDAELLLKSYDLTIGSVEYEYSDISLEGVVISQSYPAGQEVKKTTPIHVTISLGPFPKLPKIPNMVRKSLDAVKKQLKLLGVKKVTIEYEERDDILPETILEQSLAAGTIISNDTEINLLVSKLKKEEE